jgi:hypothetical protein
LNLDEALPPYVARLRGRLQAAGVDLSQPVTLKDDGHGTILVDGDHPDRSTIERILADDYQLRSGLQELAAAASEQRRGVGFEVDDPFGEFRLAIDNGSAAVRFE